MRLNGITARLPSGDLLTTIAFYVDVLGFALGSVWPEDDPTFAILGLDGVALHFYTAADDEPSGHGTLGLDVDDAAKLHEQVAHRVEVEWGPEVYWYGRREFACRDPDGYLLIFSEETDDPATCEEPA